MSDGIDRLRRTMNDAGLIGRTDVEGSGWSRILGDFEWDDRPANCRCGVCLRTIDPRRKHRMTPTEWACGKCHELREKQEGPEHRLTPEVYRHWFANHPEHRRKYLIKHFRIDPVTCTAAPTELEWLTAPLDVDGVPMTVEVNHSVGALPVVGVPYCFWDWAREWGYLRGNGLYSPDVGQGQAP